MLDQRQIFATLDEISIAHALYLSACSCDAMYRMQESKGKFRALLPDVYQTILPFVFGPRLEYMFEQSLKLSLHVPNRFDIFFKG